VTRRGALLVVIAAAIAASAGRTLAQQPVFRGGAVTVSVPAVVKRGNRVVANLKAADFRLTDNRVEQKIEAVAIESVPVDVTLFLDTSGSTAGKLDDMKRDVQGIIRMLRRGDRFRLLTIADSVDEPVPWVPAGTAVNLSFTAVGGISLVHDALVLALLHRPEADRRHLVVGMTDSRDCGSVVSSAQLRDLASRSEAVMHIVNQSGSGGDAAYRVRTCSPRARIDGPNIIGDAALRTGGTFLEDPSSFFGSPVLRAFKTIFDEFRQSYVLRYSPAGVPRGGWHAIAVEVPSMQGVTVRARQGYFD
jgi:VWFA-related protein